MRAPLLAGWFAVLALPGSLPVSLPPATAGTRATTYWKVDDVRVGMRGVGRTVMKGTRIESFDAEVLGVLRNTSPGRDMILCRLSGLNLEKTGVIAGMSGSPIYVEGRLLGAVAFAWPYGKEPIAGVTPFAQMHDFVEAYERRDLAEQAGRPKRIGLAAPLRLDGFTFDSVTVSQGFDEPPQPPADSLWMVPLRTPLVATGFTPRSLELLQQRWRASGLVPVQGGGAGARIAEQERHVPLEPGAPLAVSLVRGDLDLSGIGTVTQVEGSRVYGWGHPFFGLGACEFPLMTGYIHTIYPRQSVSFKMGSPLRPVGLINADVSTGIAGWLDRQADLLPMQVTLARETGGPGRKFNVEVARQPTLMPNLVFSVLTGTMDMEGDLPEEVTAEIQARIEVAGREPVVIRDTFSGSGLAGGRMAQALFSPVAAVVQLLTTNPFQPVRVQRIECTTRLSPGRRSVEIESVQLASDTYAPGETVKGTVFLRPFRGFPHRLPFSLAIPADLPEGSYSLTVCDDLANARQELRQNPALANPQSLEGVFDVIRVQVGVQRNHLVVRLPVPAAGVALEGKALPELPPSVVQILSQGRRTGAQPLGSAVVARQATPWVVQGSETVPLHVVKNRKWLAP